MQVNWLTHSQVSLALAMHRTARLHSNSKKIITYRGSNPTGLMQLAGTVPTEDSLHACMVLTSL